MTIYLNELAPWERKSEYFKHIKLGNDINKQSEAIKNAINSQTFLQLTKTNEIIASQERISEGIQGLSFEIKNGLHGLKSCFETGIADVVWQLEQNTSTMHEILNVLMAPLDTQAKERKKRADYAYSNGWIDDAEVEYIESEKLNKYDFSIYISLGFIYFFHKTDKKKALEYFYKAIKYSRPKSTYYTSYSLFHKSLILHSLGETEKALESLSEAISITPNFSEAIYHKAVFCGLLQMKEECIENIRLAIKLDRRYILKVNSDNLLESLSSDINKFLKDEFEINNKACREVLDLTKKNFDKVINLTRKIDCLKPLSKYKEKIDADINEIEILLSRNSLLDCLFAKDNLISLYEKFCCDGSYRVYDEISTRFSGSIEKFLDKEIYAKEQEYKNKKRFISDSFSFRKQKKIKDLDEHYEREKKTLISTYQNTTNYFHEIRITFSKLLKTAYSNITDEDFDYILNLEKGTDMNGVLKSYLASNCFVVSAEFSHSYDSNITIEIGENISATILVEIIKILKNFKLKYILCDNNSNKNQIIIRCTDTSTQNFKTIHDIPLNEFIEGRIDKKEFISNLSPMWP